MSKQYIIEDLKGGTWDGFSFRGPLFAIAFLSVTEAENEIRKKIFEPCKITTIYSNNKSQTP